MYETVMERFLVEGNYTDWDRNFLCRKNRYSKVPWGREGETIIGELSEQ